MIETIDLEKVLLYGFHSYAYHHKVLGMIKSLEASHDFSPVPVAKLSSVVYALLWTVPDPECQLSEKFTSIDGGHHRAIAHFLTSTPLKVQPHPFEEGDYGRIYLPEISIFKND